MLFERGRLQSAGAKIRNRPFDDFGAAVRELESRHSDTLRPPQEVHVRRLTLKCNVRLRLDGTTVLAGTSVCLFLRQRAFAQ